jgi:hypothetical protein
MRSGKVLSLQQNNPIALISFFVFFFILSLLFVVKFLIYLAENLIINPYFVESLRKNGKLHTLFPFEIISFSAI